MSVHAGRILPGLRTGPVAQGRRRQDGVRGLFTTRPVPRGALLLEVPRRSCYLPRGVTAYTTPVPEPWPQYAQYCRALRRLNRPATLFPESWLWMQRLSPNTEENGVSLSAQVSLDEADQAALSSGKSVVSVALTPVEAALAVSAATRFFFADAAHLSPAARTALGIGPAPSPVADAFVASLPFRQFLSRGVEGLFAASGQMEAHAHGGLEQIARNLCDAVMTHASAPEYNLLDAQPELLEEILLTAVYIVRARCLPVRLLASGSGRNADAVVSVFAPGLDALNHAGQRHTAQAAIYGAGLVVRAGRDLRLGEEVTVDYQLSLGGQCGSRDAFTGAADGRPTDDAIRHQLVADNWSEGQYMLNMQEAW